VGIMQLTLGALSFVPRQLFPEARDIPTTVLPKGIMVHVVPSNYVTRCLFGCISQVPTTETACSYSNIDTLVLAFLNISHFLTR
jgi:hypothetical protein